MPPEPPPITIKSNAAAIFLWIHVCISPGLGSCAPLPHKMEWTGFNTGKHLYPLLYAWMIPYIPRSSLGFSFSLPFPFLDHYSSLVTPNFISAVNIAVQLAYLAYYLFSGEHHILLFGATLFTYRLLDNIDGMHARATKQTSRLGEFLVRFYFFSRSLIKPGIFFPASGPLI